MLKLIIAIPLSLFFIATYCNAATSVDVFSKKLIGALENRNVVEFESLILPESLALSQNLNIEKHNNKIRLILKQKVPSEFKSYKVVITDIEQDKDYNISENKLYVFGNKWATFPQKLEKRLTIYVKEGTVTETAT